MGVVCTCVGVRVRESQSGPKKLKNFIFEELDVLTGAIQEFEHHFVRIHEEISDFLGENLKFSLHFFDGTPETNSVSTKSLGRFQSSCTHTSDTTLLTYL